MGDILFCQYYGRELSTTFYRTSPLEQPTELAPAVSYTPGCRARVRKTLFAVFSKKDSPVSPPPTSLVSPPPVSPPVISLVPPPPIHVLGILGIMGPLDGRNSGCMVSDFGAWAFLLSQMKGYSAERAMWNTIHPVTPLFPGKSVVFGDAGTDRSASAAPPTPVRNGG